MQEHQNFYHAVLQVHEKKGKLAETWATILNEV